MAEVQFDRKATIAAVYAIVNLQNKHRYIGSSVNVRSRWSQHKGALLRGRHCNRKLQSAWTMRGGEPSFAFEILEVVSGSEALRAREQWWLLNARHEYNIAIDAEASSRGLKLSAEQLAKRIGRKHPWRRAAPMPQETKDRISVGRRGKQIPLDAIARMAATKRGKPLDDRRRKILRDSRPGRSLATGRFMKTAEKA